ncbi:MAG TPA: hypothetical protein VF226_18670 [Hyphomicrobiaceae bacterium]
MAPSAVRYRSEAEGLAQAVARTRPRVCFFGHHHTRLDAEVAGVRCIGLNKVAMPGNLVALGAGPRLRDLGRMVASPGHRFSNAFVQRSRETR